ncbi:YncE family protein [candidate division FCPU426 bacterium]|nr:YncE family protein [candidate division FCPU426 bacterium]
MPPSLRLVVIGPAILFLAAGCALDQTPVIPVDIKDMSVGQAPLRLERGLLPAQFLVSCFNNDSVASFSFSDSTLNIKIPVRQGPADLIVDPRQQLVYCLHTKENVLSLLGGKPLRVRQSLATGSIPSLAGGAMRPEHNELWICDGVSAVHVLATPTIQLKKRIQIGRYPQQIAFSKDGNTALVTLKGENTVCVIDAQDGKVQDNIRVGIYPRGILVVGNTACVSNFGSHDVSIIDLTRRLERARIRVRKNPGALAEHRKTLWVSCEKSYRLAAIDIVQAKLIGTIKTGFYPGDILTLKDGSLLVTNPQKGKVALLTPQRVSSLKKGRVVYCQTAREKKIPQ